MESKNINKRMTVIYNGSKEVTVYHTTAEFDKMLNRIKDRYKYIAGVVIGGIQAVRILERK